MISKGSPSGELYLCLSLKYVIVILNEVNNVVTGEVLLSVNCVVFQIINKVKGRMPCVRGDGNPVGMIPCWVSCQMPWPLEVIMRSREAWPVEITVLV